jgi:hypothetical protein
LLSLSLHWLRSFPLGYYKNNTVNSRALIETAIKNGVRQFRILDRARHHKRTSKMDDRIDLVLAGGSDPPEADHLCRRQ